MSRLPVALAGWEEALAGLSADAARAVGPLLNVLGALIGRVDQSTGDTGDPDGYDGTTNRGDFGRLLPEEWLLATEVPAEFLRRAAEHELSFLHVAHRRPTPRGRVVAVVDTGPEQLGVGRIVQLAALVVLHRKAVEAGRDLALVVLGGPPDPVVVGAEGPDAAVLAWVSARTAATPTSEHVAAALAVADEDDRVWLLAGPTSRRLAPAGRCRAIDSQVARWDATGVGRIAVRVGDTTTEVEVPDPASAVAALRGEGILRRRHDLDVTTVPTTGHGASFHSAGSRLLWRGENDHVVYGCLADRGARARRYRFTAPVLAVNSVGRRVVAAVTDGRGVWIEVIGKALAHTERIHVPLGSLDLDATALAGLTTAPPAPLHLRGGELLLGLPTGWWLVGAGVSRTDFRSVAASAVLDRPRWAQSGAPGEWWVGRLHLSEVAGLPVLGPPVPRAKDASWVAWSGDNRVWRVARGEEVVDEIAVDEHDRVLGLGVLEENPFLVVVSRSGRIVRQVSAARVRTLTRLAGPAHFSLHPHRAWLARTAEGRITVVDLAGGETLLEIAAER